MRCGGVVAWHSLAWFSRAAPSESYRLVGALPEHQTVCESTPSLTPGSIYYTEYAFSSSAERANTAAMPPIRTARASKKAPPDGFEDLEDTLLEFQNKMKDAENASHEGKKKYEMTWPIFQITHQRSRYIYDLYYEKEAISKQLYDYLLKNGYADAMLIAKWKKQGYEKLCCTRCIQTKETNFRSTCICRVPKEQMKENQDIQCVNCGCRGCASSD